MQTINDEDKSSFYSLTFSCAIGSWETEDRRIPGKHQRRKIKRFGIILARITSSESISFNKARYSDLVFYTTKRSMHVCHTGISYIVHIIIIIIIPIRTTDTAINKSNIAL